MKGTFQASEVHQMLSYNRRVLLNPSKDRYYFPSKPMCVFHSYARKNIQICVTQRNLSLLGCIPSSKILYKHSQDLALTDFFFSPQLSFNQSTRISGGGDGLPDVHLCRRMAGLHQHESVQKQFHGSRLQHIGFCREDEH